MLSDVALTGEWTPITNFAGTFDGKGYTITGLTITQGTGNIGMFADLEESGVEIKNLTISGATISGDPAASGTNTMTGTSIGVLAGASYKKITNVKVVDSVVLTNGKYVGGLVGNAYCDVEGCTVENTQVTGKDQVGGISGYFWCGGLDSSKSIGNTIVATEERAGGLIGKIQCSTGNDSYFHFKNNEVNGGSATAPDFAGGIAAQIMSDMTNWELTGNTVTGITLNAPEISPIGTLRKNSNGAEDEDWLVGLSAVSENTWTLTMPEGMLVKPTNYGTYGASDNNTNQKVPVWVAAVAQIGNTKYATLDEAVAAVKDNEAIVLLDDVVLEQAVQVTKPVTIDGGDHTVTMAYTGTPGAGNAFFNAYAGNEGIKNNLTVKNLNMKMTGGTKSGYAVVAGMGDADFTIAFDGCSFENMWCGAMLNGCLGTKAPNVTIANCEFEDVSYGVSFAEASYAGNVTFTGNKMLGETGVQELFSSAPYITAATVEISDGYYSANPTAYVAAGYAALQNTDDATKAVYAWVVKEYVAPETAAEVAEAEPVVAIDEALTGNEETAAYNASDALIVGTQKVEVSNEPVEAAATTVANENTVTAATAKTELDAALSTTTAESNIKIVIQTYTDVEVADVTLEDNNINKIQTITYDIQPMAQKVATSTAVANDAIETEGPSQNAVKLGEPEELTITATTTVIIPLPAAFVTSSGDKYANGAEVDIEHVKSTGDTFYYKGTIKNVAGEYSVSFVNPDGFSKFTVMADAETKASVTQNGSTVYFKTLQDAVDYIEDGGTITLTAAAGSATVARTVSFTFHKAGYTGTITAGANTANYGTETDCAFVYTESYISVSSYTVTVADAAHGTVSASVAKANAGSDIKLTVKADKGWTLETITAQTAAGAEVEIKPVTYGESYIFVMPGSAVTVTATFMEDNTMLNYFVDVKAEDYYYDAVLWAAENSITSGVDNIHFDPAGITTRGQMVTFLWRTAGSPEPTAATCKFTDVAADAYYFKAVLWAIEKGITEGISATEFAPNADVTRAQAVTFLWRYEGSKTDSGKNVFTDVADGDYFYSAVLWAKAQGITTGMTDTTFVPNDTCTRGQVVTFLYRDIVK